MHLIHDRRQLRIVVSGLIIGALTLTSPPAMARSRGQNAVVGGTIEGVVVAASDERTPVPGATVTLEPVPQQGPPLSTATDAHGAFRLDSVRPGAYTLQVSCSGFGAHSFGASLPRSRGAVIVIEAGRTMVLKPVALPRGAVLAGVVRTEYGVPTPGARVTIFVKGKNGSDRIAATAVTDDRGEYRLFDLASDSYALRVEPPSDMEAPVRRVRAEDLEWVQRDANASVTASRRTPAASRRAEELRPVPVWYPAATNRSRAETIDLHHGEERGDLDVTLPLLATARLSGEVVDANGGPVVGAVVRVRGNDRSDGDLECEGLTDKSGRFTLPAVVAGSHVLEIRANPSMSAGLAESSRAATAMLQALIDGTARPNILWATTPVTVESPETRVAPIVLSSAVSIRGRVVVEGGADGRDLAGTRVVLRASRIGPGFADAMVPGGLALANVDTGNRFVLFGVPPDTYRLAIVGAGLMFGDSAPGSKFMLKSIVWNGDDVADKTLTVEEKSGGELIVTLSRLVTRLEGTVLDATGHPKAGSPVAIFPVEAAQRTAESRRIRVLMSDLDGTFTARGLPPGRYLAALVTEVIGDGLRDPDMLTHLEESAVRFVIGDAGTPARVTVGSR